MPPILDDLFMPLQSTSLAVAAARLALAMALGSALGWERERSAHAAGLRTHMLISLAAALFTLIAMELTYLRADEDASMQVDPLRLIEAVTAGVAFLAAGSIILNGGTVRGVTTGASMWLAGAIGLAAGTGRGTLAVIAALMGLLILWLVAVLAERSTGKPTDDAAHNLSHGAGPGGAGGSMPPAPPRDAKEGAPR
ncbi:MgtC/SapB family protein [Paracoccus sp. NSM]|uniref:MgtC/SapB family protein n=1 Tax=Paracoccus sp. NSM TaxID=3457784 RepID=UPI004035A481